MNFFGTSWKTTLGALLVAAGYGVSLAVDPMIGEALKVAGIALIGLAARDNSVTSHQLGLEK